MNNNVVFPLNYEFNSQELVQSNTISGLPVEILEMIFSYIHEVESIRNLRLVSNFFNQVILCSNHPKIQNAFENFFKKSVFLWETNKIEKEICQLSKYQSLKKAFTLTYSECSKKILNNDKIDKEKLQLIANIIYNNNLYNFSFWKKEDRVAIYKIAPLLGHLKIIKKFLNQESLNQLLQHNFEIIFEAIDDSKVINLIFDNVRKSSDLLDYAFRKAAEQGHKEIVELIINKSEIDTSAYLDQVVIRATINGHQQIVELLLPKTNSKLHEYLIIKAIAMNHAKVFITLIENTDNNLNTNEILFHALKYKRDVMIKYLIKNKNIDKGIFKILLTDPQIDRTYALNIAKEYNLRSNKRSENPLSEQKPHSKRVKFN